jgi:hypothetical protein
MKFFSNLRSFFSKKNDNQVQTRNENSELRYFPTVKAALQHAKKDTSVWKISFYSETNERIRMARTSEGWTYDHILEGRQIASDPWPGISATTPF